MVNLNKVLTDVEPNLHFQDEFKRKINERAFFVNNFVCHKHGKNIHPQTTN